MKDYTNLVEKFRELARDLLRIRWINNIKDEILAVENKITECNKDKDYSVKEIARANFRLSKLEEANPDYEELKENEEQRIKAQEKRIEEVGERLAERQERKDFLNKEIIKVESGELKVSAESLSEKSKELAESYVKEIAKQIK